MIDDNVMCSSFVHYGLSFVFVKLPVTYDVKRPERYQVPVLCKEEESKCFWGEMDQD